MQLLLREKYKPIWESGKLQSQHFQELHEVYTYQTGNS
ncbi:hypothetical protein CIPAW_03G031300 [Carya illinoinensis]|uniref:Uncharacterized protein n=1 Tax=Carya illinoinensis TaxID=32201 RepID=A0A8T1QWC5_CARIL|nr:hypothetical protein CIPAW_03G031300 [Carya illinoinensis]